MALPRPARPSVILADIRAFLAGNQKHKLLLGVLAVAMPALIVFGFVLDSRSGILPGRQTIYVAEYSNDRTDAQIIADQKVDQKQRAIAAAEKKAAYQRLAKRLGIE